MRRAIIPILLLSGCATEAVHTPQQARAIGLASVCAETHVKLDPNEELPTNWTVDRVGDRWHVWLPTPPNAKEPPGTSLKGAWIEAKDGKVVRCEERRL